MAEKKPKPKFNPGQNPNSRKALDENRHKGAFTADVAVELGRKGAEESHKVQAEIRKGKDMMKRIFELKPLEKNTDMLKVLGMEDTDINNKMLLLAGLFQRGLKTGDPATVRLCLEIEGDAPVSKADISGSPVTVVIQKGLPPDDY